MTDTSSGARTSWRSICTVASDNADGEVLFAIDGEDDDDNVMDEVDATTDASTVSILQSSSSYGAGGGGGSGGGETVSGESQEVSSEDEEVSGEDVEVSNEGEVVVETDEEEGNTADEEEELMEEDEEEMDDEEEEESVMVELESETFVGFQKYLADNGIITSAADCDEARCEDEIARKELAAIAVRLGGHPMVEMENYGYFFSDVDYENEDDWVPGIVEAAVAAEIVSSSNATFRPDDGASRAETYAMLMSSVCIDIPSVSDDWKTDVFLTASALGFTVRSESEFEGDNMVLRQEVFAIATRILQYTHAVGGCE